MTPTTQLSMWHLMATASPIVKLVMLLLLSASIWSWTLIFQRFVLLKQSRAAFKSFQKTFWSGLEMAQLYRDLSTQNRTNSGAAAIFCGGFKDFVRMQQYRAQPPILLEAAERSMRVALAREADRLEQGLSILATIGSVSPYIGLFGTVWGIMQSFSALSGVEQATLSMVAPGISEALIATAMGLFAAIPAVIAYNRITSHVDSLLGEYEHFQEDFAGILHREVYRQGKE